MQGRRAACNEKRKPHKILSCAITIFSEDRNDYMDIMALRDGYIPINSRLSYSHYPFFRGTGRGVEKWVDGEIY